MNEILIRVQPYLAWYGGIENKINHTEIYLLYVPIRMQAPTTSRWLINLDSKTRIFLILA
jgi:hypothetical protein